MDTHDDSAKLSLATALETTLLLISNSVQSLNYLVLDTYGTDDWALMQIVFADETDAVWTFPAEKLSDGWYVHYPGSSGALRLLERIPPIYNPLADFDLSDWRLNTPEFLVNNGQTQEVPQASNATLQYRLPYANGTSVYITQDSSHHGGPIDMVGQSGKTIVAAADGWVRTVVQSHNECCRSSVCNPCENTIVMEHANNEWTIYRHIAQNSAQVTVGQYVPAGAPLGTEGDVGWTSGSSRPPVACNGSSATGNCGRHLHFELRLGGRTGTYDNPNFCNVGSVVQTQTYTASACSNLPPPSLNAPANGSTNQSTTPTFSWSQVTGATSYRIMVATNPADLPTDPNATTGGPSVVINELPTTNSFTPSTSLNSGTTYYWEVKARGNTVGNWSNKWSFTTVGTTSAAELTKQSDNLSNLNPRAGDTVTTSLVIQNRSCSGSSANAGSFHVGFYWSTNPNFSGVSPFGWAPLSGCAANGTVSLNQPITIGSNTGPGTYYLGYKIDDQNEVAECNENNNGIYYWTVTVQGNSGTVVKNDFNSDGKTDIIIQNSSGLGYIFFMDGQGRQQSGAYLNYGQTFGDWKIVATGDFNSDGKTDIIIQNSSGFGYIFFMDGQGRQQSGAYLNYGQTFGDWKIVATGDFNSDGKTDIIIQNSGGLGYVFFMDGQGRQQSGAYLNYGQTFGDWKIVAAGDFNSDGKTDIIIQNSSGFGYIFFMDGQGRQQSGAYLNYGQTFGDWKIRP